MNRRAALLIAIGGLACLFCRFPLFHVLPLERATREKAAAMFNPTASAKKFWSEQLLESLERATKADELLPAIQSSQADAKKKFSRSVGVSESYTYFVSGQGRVLAVS